MPTLSKTRSIIIGSAAVLLLTIGIFLGALYYLNEASAAVSTLEGEVSSEKGTAEAARALERLLSENAGKITHIDSFFIASDEEADFIKQVEKIATDSKTDFEISTFSREQIADNDKFEYVVMQGSARGALTDVYQLLMLLEAFPKALEVNRVGLEYIPGDPKKPREWRLAFMIRALKIK